jgi:hypothetical protein
MDMANLHMIGASGQKNGQSDRERNLKMWQKVKISLERHSGEGRNPVTS